ncbi:hypothetical protein ACFYY5_35050 [Nocardia elegans]|uniref:Uncharacterized protein n=1 Tax=Nocardia elegans TaxID=300029 RepID=A0ABW6TT23_9NOCA
MSSSTAPPARARHTAKGPQHARELGRYKATNPLPRNTLEARMFAVPRPAQRPAVIDDAPSMS